MKAPTSPTGTGPYARWSALCLAEVSSRTKKFLGFAFAPLNAPLRSLAGLSMHCSFRCVRALFFGTPEIAIPSLHALAEVAEIHSVICQPDRPSGRGLNVRPPAVKEAALKLGLEIYQPEKVKDGGLEHYVRSANVDLALVIAYGRILPPSVLSVPPLGFVNLHASLLPKYRGAAPIQRALMEGESETGVCLMQMDEGMDTGAVLASRSTPIADLDDHSSLGRRLGTLAAELTREELPRLVSGELSPTPQDGTQASYARPILASDTVLDPTRPAQELARQVRGLAPRPGAFAVLQRADEKHQTKAPRLKILRAQALDTAGEPGRLTVRGSSLLLGCAQGSLVIELAQLEGKKPQTAKDLLNGRLLADGDRLATPSAI